MWPLNKNKKSAQAKRKAAPKRPQRAVQSRTKNRATPGSKGAVLAKDSLRTRLVRTWQRSQLFRRTAYGFGGAMTLGVCTVLLINSTIPQRVADWTNETVHQTFVSAGFVVQDVTVAGRHRTDRDALIAALGAAQGMPILDLSPAQAQQRIEALPWVAEARVARLLPDTLHIVLIERDPFAIWQQNNQLSLIDREGVAISGVDIGPYAALPIIAGEGAPEHAAEILDLLRAEPTLGKKVDAAVRVGDRRWNVRLTNGVTVALPEVNPGRAWAFLSDLQQDQNLLAREIDMIDLRQDRRITIKAKKKNGSGSGDDRVQVILTKGTDA